MEKASDKTINGWVKQKGIKQWMSKTMGVGKGRGRGINNGEELIIT